jgi:hypothetical protein
MGRIYPRGGVALRGGEGPGVTGVEGVANMRTWTMAFVVGVGLLAAGITVASRAWAAEFSCTIPATSGTTCGIPKLTLRPQEKITIAVTSVKLGGDDLGTPHPTFQFKDANNNDAVLVTLTVAPGTSSTYQNKNDETDQTFLLWVNINKYRDVEIQGSYKISK